MKIKKKMRKLHDCLTSGKYRKVLKASMIAVNVKQFKLEIPIKEIIRRLD